MNSMIHKTSTLNRSQQNIVKGLFFLIIVTDEEKHKEEIKKIQEEKIETKSRRWGETRRKREDEAIMPIKKKELLVINTDTQQIFINRFNSLCNHFFFPMVVPLRNKKKFLLKEPILLAKVISWISTYLKNASMSL
jgi:hypothetical protein